MIKLLLNSIKIKIAYIQRNKIEKIKIYIMISLKIFFKNRNIYSTLCSIIYSRKFHLFYFPYFYNKNYKVNIAVHLQFLNSIVFF